MSIDYIDITPYPYRVLIIQSVTSYYVECAFLLCRVCLLIVYSVPAYHTECAFLVYRVCLLSI